MGKGGQETIFMQYAEQASWKFMRRRTARAQQVKVEEKRRDDIH